MNKPDVMQETLDELGRCILALGEYRRSAVLTGGLVPFMYRFVPGFAATNRLPPVQTFDLDWTVPNPLDVRGTLLDRRLLDSGFVVVLGGEQPPHVTFYQSARFGGATRGPIHVEFLTPRKGGATVRGRDRTVVEVQEGLTAQALPFLDLLLHASFAFDVSAVPGIGVGDATEILLPEPMAYILQKTLARNHRRSHKRAGDQAHIHDVALLTRPVWPQMVKALSNLRDAGFPDSWFVKARYRLGHLYASPESDGPVEVARVVNGRTGTAKLQESSVHRTMRRLLESLGWG